jgi:hypothetical protein
LLVLYIQHGHGKAGKGQNGSLRLRAIILGEPFLRLSKVSLIDGSYKIIER